MEVPESMTGVLAIVLCLSLHIMSSMAILQNGSMPGPLMERFSEDVSFQSTNGSKAVSLPTGSGGCPCTWDAKYPCSLKGSCWTYSTKSSCKAKGGLFCGSGNGGTTCDCTWNKKYQCKKSGSCWNYGNQAACVSSGGAWCGTPGPTPAPTPPPGPAPSSMRAVLNQHNYYRAKHSVPPLGWDAALAKQAASWARKCVWKHSSMGNGENLWTGTGSFNGAAAVTSWYNEIKDYDYKNPGFTHGTGHFTQVVWKSTSRVGCAMKVCNPLSPLGWRNAKYLVCEYSPPGNYLGQFGQNVLPPKSLDNEWTNSTLFM